ncbi:MAG: hypothetical protein HYU64_03080 [Armatimonadetes bacterium]|nr:hypothetical protein [Armatimonadota bacterium]
MKKKLSRKDIAIWKRILEAGSRNASNALTEMLGFPLEMSAVVLANMPISRFPFLAGNPEEVSAGIRLVFTGDVSGQIMLVFPLASAYQFVDMLMERPKGATRELGEVEISALSEFANVASCCFVRDLADRARVSMDMSPPEAVVDMTAAVLEATILHLWEQTDYALTMETLFRSEGSETNGYFFFVPDVGSADLLMNRLKAVKWNQS